METLYATELSVPLYQVCLLLVLSTLVLFVGKVKLALLINYTFVLYWGYWLSREKVLASNVFEIDSFTIGYFGFGLLIIILALIGFMNRTG